ncbi:MAG: twin-arginine translocation signal domain-containing protein, partial [Nitrospirae bacterium]
MATESSLERSRGWLDPSLSRRTFLKSTAAVAAAAAAGPLLRPRKAEAVTTGGLPADPIEQDENIVYSACLQCHGGCGIRAKVVDGVLVKIDGNPYHPNAAEVGHRLPYATPRADSIHT